MNAEVSEKAQVSEKLEEYLRIAQQFLDSARLSRSRADRLRKRAQAAEWIKRAEDLPSPPKQQNQRGGRRSAGQS